MLAREAVSLCPAVLGLVLSTITSPSPRSPEYLRNLVLGWAWSMGDATFLALCFQSIRNNGHDAPPPATVGVADLGVPPGPLYRLARSTEGLCESLHHCSKKL